MGRNGARGPDNAPGKDAVWREAKSPVRRARPHTRYRAGLGFARQALNCQGSAL
jgi:hypothetical protein